MSYCRWSSDSHRCDIYAYESEAGFEVHVAARRYNLPADVVAPSWDDPEWATKYESWAQALRDAELVPIGLPFDGHSYVCETEGEMFECIIALAAAGYKIPAGLFADIGHPDNCDCACHRLNSPLIASDCPCGPRANPQATTTPENVEEPTVTDRAVSATS